MPYAHWDRHVEAICRPRRRGWGWRWARLGTAHHFDPELLLHPRARVAKDEIVDVHRAGLLAEAQLGLQRDPPIKRKERGGAIGVFC